MKSELDLLFYFLHAKIDWTESLEQIHFGMGYDLGDFHFEHITNPEIVDIVNTLYVQLNKLALIEK